MPDPAPAAAAGSQFESPEHFLGSSPMLDLQDSRLRLRARSLTQLCKTERDKAVALHDYVKRLPFERPLKWRLRTARAVMDAGAGDATDKATLLVALLRLIRIPARIRYVELRNELMRGLGSGTENVFRPVVEVWLRKRWVRTDSYIYDPGYMAAARQRLKDHDWEHGYGIHRHGHSVWNGTDDAFVGGLPTEADPLVVQTLGLFHDPRQFMQSEFFRKRYGPFGHAILVNTRAFAMRQVLRELRQEVGAEPLLPQPRRLRRPS
ncbi:MAG: hypothetical protein NVSMB34_07080 [Variovorax sp.]